MFLKMQAFLGVRDAIFSKMQAFLRVRDVEGAVLYGKRLHSVKFYLLWSVDMLLKNKC